MRKRVGWAAVGLLALASAGPALADDEVAFGECLVSGPILRVGRWAVPIDPLGAAIALRKLPVPAAGKPVLPGAAPRWAPMRADAKGWFQGRALGGGYAAVSYTAPEDGVALLDARGASRVYVNGVPRGGNPYAKGWWTLPVALRAGQNWLLFACARGRLRVRLRPAPRPVVLDRGDPTLPDLVVGEPTATPAGVNVLNATGETLSGLTLEVGPGDGAPLTSAVAAVPDLPPCSRTKVPVPLRGEAPKEAGAAIAWFRLLRGGELLDRGTLKLRVRAPDESRKRTFLSAIDGSAQYYAVRPALAGPDDPPPALVLTLHGAGVEARGQADAYGSKRWAHLVAPTNRRPFGFDWEDWGRLDALEVLGDAQRRLRHDPRRVVLTGHSMGGHGAWHLSVTYPDRFAAVGPSAGWISFQTYGSAAGQYGAEGPIGELLARAGATSDTQALLHNLEPLGVYVLHGDQDDNVPVAQARRMLELLAPFHHDLHSHEEPGKKHWWDASDEPGASCVDWPPMFDLFARRSLPDPREVRRVQFATFSPAVSPRSSWVRVEAQQQAMALSTVDLEADPHHRRVRGTTGNVRRLTLDLAPLIPGDAVRLDLDGGTQDVPWPAAGRLHLERGEGGWAPIAALDPARKGAHRSGPFKEAFRNGVVLVYGTRGTAAETAANLIRARQDAETFLYRGNGALRVIADVAFDPAAEPDRNVVLYGNGDSNAAWGPLLGEGPVGVGRAGVRVGDRVLAGDLIALFVRPRPGSDRALVGAVAGTTPTGILLSASLPLFVSGAGFPDLLVLGPEALFRPNVGVRVTGFFDDAWGLDQAELAWGK